jgi:hypothetical protein
MDRNMSQRAMTGTPERMQRRGPWIRSRNFDVVFVFGGLLGSLVLGAVTLANPALIPALFWLWILTGDGPHMFATYVRTYLDEGAWRTMKPLLLRSTLAFAIGPACLILDAMLHSDQAFLAFNGIAGLYGFHHVTRQHYGFVALYRARGRGSEPQVLQAGSPPVSSLEVHLDRWALYLGCVIPYVYFVFSHPRSRALIGLADVPLGLAPSVLLLVLWLGAMGGFCIGTLRAGNGASLKLAYGIATSLFHGVLYGYVGHFEPVYARADNPNQEFLLLVMMTSVFHNVQYVALVYALGNAEIARSGVTPWLRENGIRFIGVFVVFMACYVATAAGTGVFPVLQWLTGRNLGPFRLNDVMLSVWWGMSLHHYYLDQHIWRIRNNAPLRTDLVGV